MKQQYQKDHRNVGIKIAYYRMHRNMTQQQLANKMELEPQHISRYERGAVGFSYDRILDFARALGIKPYLLLYHDDILEDGQVEPTGKPSTD